MPFHRTLSSLFGGVPVRSATFLGLSLILAGCGYKGPLYMPPPPPAPQEELTSPPSSPDVSSVSTPSEPAVQTTPVQPGSAPKP